MALNIKNPEADRLAKQLAQATGESLTEAVLNTLRERLVRETARKDEQVLERLREIQERFSELPVLDSRTPDDLSGYDENGLPS
jgi:antitoxin VapB